MASVIRKIHIPIRPAPARVAGALTTRAASTELPPWADTLMTYQ
jgi:hypothetical protein